jgi:glycosyltransferase involved in cell wall biosynthesis
MKNIIYTGAFRFPIGDAGASRVLNNSKILRKLGYDINIISWGGKYSLKKEKNIKSYYYEGFKYYISNDIDKNDKNILKRIYNNIFAGINSIQIIKNNLKNIDIIIVYNPTLFITLYLLALSKKYKIKIISDISEWYDFNDYPKKYRFLLALLNEFNMRIAQKQVYNKILISTYLNNYYKSSNNITLPPLVDQNEEKWKEKENNYAPYKGLRLIYTGYPKNKEMIENVLEAIIACIKNGINIQFLILGPAIEDISNYRKIIESNLINKHIYFLGKMSQNEVPSKLKSSNFSLIIRKPSKKNIAGFPTKMVESMMAGCPVIINNVGDMIKYVTNGYNGFIIPDYSVSAIEKVLRIVSDLDVYSLEKMKENALRVALECFDYNLYIIQMKLFLEKLI